MNLLNLPQELLDIIFRYAYPKVEDFNVKDPETWDRSQAVWSMRADDPIEPVPYPGPEVNKFLLSKKYFVSASRAYISNQRIEIHKGQQEEKLRGIIGAFAEDVKSYHVILSRGQLPNCKRFKFEISEREPLPVPPTPKVKYKKGDIEIMKRDYKCLSDFVQGLQELKIVKEDVVDWLMHDEEKWANKRVERMEEVLRPLVGIKRETSYITTSPGDDDGENTPLYPGSAVNW